MSSAPAWVTYAALGVAALSFLNSVATYRRSGPLVKARVSIADNWQSAQDLRIRLELNNKGLSEVDVDAVMLAYPIPFSIMSSLIYICDLSAPDPHEGPDMPYSLRKGSSQTWIFNPYESFMQALPLKFKLIFRWDLLGPINPFRFLIFFAGPRLVVRLGTGQRVVSRPSWGLFWASIRLVYKLYKAMRAEAEAITLYEQNLAAQERELGACHLPGSWDQGVATT